MNWKATRPDWLRDKKINLLVQIGLTKAPDLPDVPLLIDLAKNEEDRAVLMLLSASVTIGRPLYVAPGVPAERLSALREAFAAALRDPELIEESKKLRLNIAYVPPDILQGLVDKAYGADAQTLERVRKAMR